MAFGGTRSWNGIEPHKLQICRIWWQRTTICHLRILLKIPCDSRISGPILRILLPILRTADEENEFFLITFLELRSKVD